MKKILSLLSLAALAIGLLGSCSKINERIDSLEKRIDGIESTSIASVQQQIDGIKASITKLEAADVTVNGKIDDLKATAETHQTLIDALQEADRVLGQKDDALEARIATLEGQVTTINGQIDALVNADIAINTRIDTLSTYVDTQIGKAKDWAEETFATLEQYQQTADDLAALSVTVSGINSTLAGVQTSIAALDTKINGIDADLQGKITAAKTELEGKITSLKTELEGKIAEAISASETSIKTWINELLEGYYTAAQVDAKIDALNTAIEAAKGTAKERIDSVATELTALKTAVDTAKTAIRTEYKNAIDVAINKLDGEIRGALLDSIAAVNGRIEALDTRVATLESRVLAVEGNVNKLLAMIQSVSITPAYSDGSVEAVNGILTLKCIVSPAEALIGMESLKDSLLIYADSVTVKTKATTPAYMTIEVSEASVLDAAQGAITLKADISKCLPKGENKALTVAVNIKNGISDYTTKFVPVYVDPRTFKAVYNTNGGANTLTFYFDTNDHSGEGITVYDYLPAAATKAADWGYYDKRGEIKSVVIDVSVAGYKGLTSTASMFQGMAKATNISGAEYLDVSNVTDMSYMFQNFGGGNTNSHTTLNSVPNVSGWNIGNVTNMTAMFESYGNFSDNLAIVPDVSNWNTGNVTDMTYMFQKYGHESQTFNAVPDVSKWNTCNVTNMQQMFMEYGHKSTALNTVPNVSGWNTGNVTKISNLFNGYGHTSNIIDCTLDLSGWDLSKITGNNGENVFNFTPSTFNITIPAKTGDKPNEGGVWCYGDGNNSIAPPTDKTFAPLPAGALKGVFSVSATNKVHFSQGNLYWDGDSYEFEENQYTIGTWNAENHVNYFFWSKSSSVAGAASYADASAAASDVFFTNATAETAKADFTVNGVTGEFRTLSAGEWTYILSTRANAADLLVEDVTVCDVAHCLVIAPDACLNSYVFDKTKKSYDAAAWATAEAAGLVCLPPAGYRDGTEVKSGEGNGFYWASTTNAADKASNLGFKKSDN